MAAQRPQHERVALERGQLRVGDPRAHPSAQGVEQCPIHGPVTSHGDDRARDAEVEPDQQRPMPQSAQLVLRPVQQTADQVIGQADLGFEGGTVPRQVHPDQSRQHAHRVVPGGRGPPQGQRRVARPGDAELPHAHRRAAPVDGRLCGAGVRPVEVQRPAQRVAGEFETVVDAGAGEHRFGCGQEQLALGAGPLAVVLERPQGLRDPRSFRGPPAQFPGHRGESGQRAQLRRLERPACARDHIQHGVDVSGAADGHRRRRDQSLPFQQLPHPGDRPGIRAVVGCRHRPAAAQHLAPEPPVGRYVAQRMGFGLTQTGPGHHAETVRVGVHPERRVGSRGGAGRGECGAHHGVGAVGRDDVAKSRQDVGVLSAPGSFDRHAVSIRPATAALRRIRASRAWKNEAT